MKKITHALKVLWAFWYFFIFALIFLLMYPAFAILLQKEKWYVHANWLRVVWAKGIFLFTGIKYRISYDEKLKKGQSYIFCPNHFSYLDIPMSALVARPNWRFMAKEELGGIPLLRIFFRTVDISVNRANARESFKAVQEASESLHRDMNIVIYPEGTISPHPPEMVRFKNGPFRLAIQEQVPIVPVTLPDTWKLLFVDGWKMYGRPGLSRVFVHSPIETKGMTMDDVGTLKERVREIIEGRLRGEW